MSRDRLARPGSTGAGERPWERWPRGRR